MSQATQLFLLFFKCALGGCVTALFFRLITAWGGLTGWAIGVYTASLVIVAAAGGLFGGLFRSERKGLLLLSLSAFGLMGSCIILGWLLTGWFDFAFSADRTPMLYFQSLVRTALVCLLPFGLFWAASTRISLREEKPLSKSLAGVILFFLGLAVTWLILPLLNATITLQVCCVLLLLPAVIMLAVDPKRRYLKIPCALLLLMLGYPCLKLQTPEPLFANGPFGFMVNRDTGFSFTPSDKIKSHESRWGEIRCTYDNPDYGKVVTSDGRPVYTSKRFVTARVLTSVIPLLLRPEARNVAVFGPEAWVYKPDFERQQNGRTFDFGARRLAKNKTKYDVMFVATEPAWQVGADHFTSRGFYKSCSRRMAPDGLIAIRVDGRALDAKALTEAIATLRKVFPHTQLWCTGINDWLMVGCRAPIKVPFDRMLEQFNKDSTLRCIVDAEMRNLPDIFSAFVCSDGALELTAPEAPRLSPLRCVFDSRQGSRLLEGIKPTPGDFEWLLPGQMDLDIYLEQIKKIKRNVVDARRIAAKARISLSDNMPEDCMAFAAEAAAINPRDTLILELKDRLELEARRWQKIGNFKRAGKAYENVIKFAEPDPLLHYGRAQALRSGGDLKDAYKQFRIAAALAPRIVEYQLDYAQTAVDAELFPEAAAAYKQIADRFPEWRDEATFQLAQVYSNRKSTVRNPELAIELAEKLCVRTGWKNPRYTTGLANIYIDCDRVRDGVQLKRTLKKQAEEK